MAGAWQVRAPPSFLATRATKASDPLERLELFLLRAPSWPRSGAYEVAPFTMSCLRRALCWSLAFSSSIAV